MGNWSINIQGTGCNHNGKPEDADQIALRFVCELLRQGQSVTSASINCGGRDDLLNLVMGGASVRAIINGVHVELPRIMTYETLVAHVSAKQPVGSNPSVTYHIPGRNTGGILSPGNRVILEENIVFNVCDTSNA